MTSAFTSVAQLSRVPRVIERFREVETTNPMASVGARMTARARAKLEREVRRLVS